MVLLLHQPLHGLLVGARHLRTSSTRPARGRPDRRLRRCGRAGAAGGGRAGRRGAGRRHPRGAARGAGSTSRTPAAPSASPSRPSCGRRSARPSTRCCPGSPPTPAACSPPCTQAPWSARCTWPAAPVRSPRTGERSSACRADRSDGGRASGARCWRGSRRWHATTSAWSTCGWRCAAGSGRAGGVLRAARVAGRRLHRGALRLAPGDTRDEVLMQRILRAGAAAGRAAPAPGP